MNTQEDNKLLLKKVNELSNLLKDTRSKTEENQLEGQKRNEFKRTLHNSNASNGFNCVVHEKEIKDLEKENNLLQMMIFDKDRKNKNFKLSWQEFSKKILNIFFIFFSILGFNYAG